jgi:hypothetical protein
MAAAVEQVLAQYKVEAGFPDQQIKCSNSVWRGNRAKSGIKDVHRRN